MVREKSFLLILLLELVLISASSFMSLGYVMFTSPESSGMFSKLTSLVYVGVVTDSVDEFTEVMEQQGVNYKFYNNIQNAKEDFKAGRLDSLIEGEIDYSVQPSPLTVYLPSNSPKASLTRISLKKILMDLEKKVRRIKIDRHLPGFDLFSYNIVNYNRQARYIEVYYIFTIPLILFLPALVAGSLSIDSITQEIEDKSVLNLLDAPLSSHQIIAGKNLGAILAAVIQCVLWIVALDLVAVNIWNKLQVLVLCILYSILFVNLGSIMALIFRRMKISQIAYTVFSISSISLYSPMASVHPVLLSNSPAYLFAQTTIGYGLSNNLPQLALLIGLVSSSMLVLWTLSRRIENPL